MCLNFPAIESLFQLFKFPPSFSFDFGNSHCLINAQLIEAKNIEKIMENDFLIILS